MKMAASRTATTAHKVAGCRAGWIATVLVLVPALFCPALAEYRVGPGEVIEISVLGVPELQRRVPVEPDGTISFPVIGTVWVDGLTLPELRAKIKSALIGRSVTLRGSNNGPDAVALEVDDIVVGVAAYRPVYIKGDVVKAGEYPYRGPMAIREAVALAGGYPILRSTGEELVLRSLDFKGELETLWLEFAKERARVWRINAEIGENVEDRDAIGQSVPTDAPIMRSVLAAIVEQAAKQLESRQSNQQREQNALDEIITQLGEEIAVTSDQVKAEEEAYQADMAELANLAKLRENGVVTTQRFSDARRAVVFSSTRVLQTSARLNECKRQKTERQLQQHKLSADRKITLYQELETATARLGEIRAKLRTVAEKLQFATGVRPTQGDRVEAPPTFLVRRRTSKGVERLVGTEDFELVPGDVIDVVLHHREVVQGELAQTSR